MKKILILGNVDPNTSPRPNRMILWLKDKYQVTVVARQAAQVDGLAASHVITPTGLFGTLGGPQGSLQLLRRFVERTLMWARGDFEGMIWASMNSPQGLRDLLAAQDFDLIISHDCTMLPLAYSIKGDKKTRVMLDARDYYPRNFDDQLSWRLFIRPINEYLCRHYLPMCDKIITVCDGIAHEYERVYKVVPEVILNLPQAQDLVPAEMQPDKVRMIYHGSATPSRQIELMIEIMDLVDERFQLDLMMIGSGAYFRKIGRLAQSRKNVRIIPTVPMPEIVPFTNHYDIGLFLVPPSNFNLKYALPNKLFEFIQGRLAVAIGPSLEMAKIVQKYDCGVVADDFSPQALARALNSLTGERIAYYKQRSHQASAVLNAEANRVRVHQIVDRLVQ